MIMKIKTEKIDIRLVLTLILVLSSTVSGKGGRGGGSRGSSSRGSSSRGSSSHSSSGGWSWFGGGSKSSSSSDTHSSPSSSHTSGWNLNSAKSPSGPPPPYPGLHNKHVPSNNAPPGYSPSYNSPPGYHSTYYNSPGHYYNYNNYGRTFGSQGLSGNTYISNNYYGTQKSGSSGLLTNALFYGAGTHHGHSWGHHHRSHSSSDHNRRRWDDDDDRKWRETTKAPYFENKVPGESKILPASAVIGAATAFGLASLLPLNVPENKPLMYCNNTELEQCFIQIDNERIYQCINSTIQVSCSKKLENATEYQTKFIDESNCLNKTLECDLEDNEIIGNTYCSNGTLLSKEPIFCNSTIILDGTNINKTTTILNCYKGNLPDSQASFIPTTMAPPQKQFTTTEKSLSLSASVHVFILKLLGKGHVLEKSSIPEATEIPQLSSNEVWIPEALTISPETTTTEKTASTTTEAPFEWMMPVFVQQKDGSYGTTLKPVYPGFIELQQKINNLIGKLGGKETTLHPDWVKVYITKPMETTTTSLAYNPETSTSFESLTTADSYYFDYSNYSNYQSMEEKEDLFV